LNTPYKLDDEDTNGIASVGSIDANGASIDDNLNNVLIMS
jgi:hypothetical protein